MSEQNNPVEYSNSRSVSQKLITTFLIVVICLNFGLTIFLFVNYFKTNNELQTLENKITINKVTQNYTDETLLAYYRELSDKADVGLDRVIAVSAMILGVTTLFGGLMAFRAPKDFDKKINLVENLATETKINADKAKCDFELKIMEVEQKAIEAKNGADDAKYFSELIEILTNDFDDEVPIEFKINELSKAIIKYPNRADTYRHRGVCYYSIAVKATNIRPYDLNKIENNLKLSIADFDTAIKLDNKHFNAYNSRGVSYSYLAQINTNRIEKHDLLIKSMDDFRKALIIDPNHLVAKKNLEIAREFLDELLATPQPENSNTPQESHP
jgi:tetratricopeptide (TPR) repeat protein